MKNDTPAAGDNTHLQRAIGDRINSDIPITEAERIAIMQMAARYDCIGMVPQDTESCVASALEISALVNDAVDTINEEIGGAVQ